MIIQTPKTAKTFADSTECNIKDVLQAIDYHLDPEKINSVKSLEVTASPLELEDFDGDLPF